MRVRIIQAGLGTINQICALTTSCAVVLSIGALVLGLLRALRWPSKGTHRVRKFALPFSDDLERLLLCLEEQAILITVRSRVCECVDSMDGLEVGGLHHIINACSVIANIHAVLLEE